MISVVTDAGVWLPAGSVLPFLHRRRGPTAAQLLLSTRPHEGHSRLGGKHIGWITNNTPATLQLTRALYSLSRCRVIPTMGPKHHIWLPLNILNRPYRVRFRNAASFLPRRGYLQGDTWSTYGISQQRSIFRDHVGRTWCISDIKSVISEYMSLISSHLLSHVLGEIWASRPWSLVLFILVPLIYGLQEGWMPWPS